MTWTLKLTVMGTAIMGLRPTEYIDLHCHLLPGLDDGPSSLLRQSKWRDKRWLMAFITSWQRHII